MVRLSQTIGTCPYDSLEHRLPEEVEQKIRDIVSEDADLQQFAEGLMPVPAHRHRETFSHLIGSYGYI